MDPQLLDKMPEWLRILRDAVASESQKTKARRCDCEPVVQKKGRD